MAVLNLITTAAMIAKRRSAIADGSGVTPAATVDVAPALRALVVTVVVAFVALQATNSAAVAIMGLFVTERLQLPLVWSGIALAVSALLEIPALLLLGRLSHRYSSYALLATGCIAGAAYYAAMTVLGDPVTLLAVQPLNAWFFGTVAGVGLTLFQDLIPRPGLASGLFTNTRRIGAIVSGGIIAAGSSTVLGYGGVFAICAVIAVGALILVAAVRRQAGRTRVG